MEKAREILLPNLKNLLFSLTKSICSKFSQSYFHYIVFPCSERRQRLSLVIFLVQKNMPDSCAAYNCTNRRVKSSDGVHLSFHR